jgi:hypothetical protein
MNFEIDSETLANIDKWLMEEIYAQIIEHQKQTIKQRDSIIEYFWETGHPYGGAIGSGVTYSFTL